MFGVVTGVQTCALPICLGNPGPQYDGTRHNVGFALVDALARSAGSGSEWKGWGKSLVCRVSAGALSLLLAKPPTFMNLRGEAVQELLAFYKIPPRERPEERRGGNESVSKCETRW